MKKPKKKDITLLSLDHPGANDTAYRKRRKFIVDKADEYLKNPSVFPHVKYSDTENGTWKTISKKLSGLHERFGSRSYLKAKERLALPKHRIPQLDEVSEHTKKLNSVKVEPIGGLVDVRWFLGKLGDRTMISTQYIRHDSRPDYTPEPDIVHEIIGHVPMLLEPEFADFSERLGKAARKATASQLKKIEQLYWFTIEFGLIREGKDVKAFGAGLLSSFGELPFALSGKPIWKPFSMKEVIETPYTYSEMQKILFIIPSFESLKRDTERFLKRERL